MISNILSIISVAILWIVSFVLNEWVFNFSYFSQFASWIFIPAALRILAILLWGYLGFAGLFLGALCLNIYRSLNMNESVMLAFLSSIAPLVAINLYFHFFGIDNDLVKLTGKDLVGISIFGALISSFIHSLYFITQFNDLMDYFLVMLVGDFVGTFLILVLASLSLKLFDEFNNINKIS